MGVAGSAISAIKTVMPKSAGQALGMGMAGAGMVFTATSTVADYKEARAKGDSKLVSIAKAGATFAVYDMMGLAMIPLSLASAGVQMTMASGRHKLDITQQGYNRRGKLGPGYFDMSEAGYTMRQRSINAIQNNGLNLNSALGNEARTYYRSTI